MIKESADIVVHFYADPFRFREAAHNLPDTIRRFSIHLFLCHPASSRAFDSYESYPLLFSLGQLVKVDDYFPLSVLPSPFRPRHVQLLGQDQARHVRDQRKKRC